MTATKDASPVVTLRELVYSARNRAIEDAVLVIQENPEVSREALIDMIMELTKPLLRELQ